MPRCLREGWLIDFTSLWGWGVCLGQSHSEGGRGVWFVGK